MTIRKTLRAGHPLLRQRARAVPKNDIGTKRLGSIIEDMFETMHDQDGVGLAAPQVQIPRRMFVYEIEPNPRYEDLDLEIPRTVCINPVVTDLSEETLVDWEGCLSLPELRGKVSRSKSLYLQAMDENGNSFEKRVEGFEARVVQHEVDHLNGQLFVDRMESMESLSFFEEFQEYQAEE